MMTLYFESKGSRSASRNSIPSVIYLMRVVAASDLSSKRIVYPTLRGSNAQLSSQKDLSPRHPFLPEAPTSFPNSPPISTATLCATVVAAIRLGCPVW
ncbi:MAG: hypothetical protein BJ554DRAFT_6771 [Olpidium bornovanus]|uniref:Uncharacterized protein n=1 Tax=Olpidium bornovanus TaxID=278681 RepID=A0A8H8DJZ3_9FUNG|nr:MAG: hypothetical protein BJ554DRAFT_6771 [Olpidium bornovanus]